MKKGLTTLERLVLFRNFDDRRSVLHDRNFAGRAEIGVTRFVGLPTRNATPLSPTAKHQVKLPSDQTLYNKRTFYGSCHNTSPELRLNPCTRSAGILEWNRTRQEGWY